MYKYGTDISDFDAVRLAVASPADILDWSYGEVTKPETINYRTQKPERDGLFCERIFGPVKDINPHDSKYKGLRSREAAVDKNGELVTKSVVRRERMGHIQLASPVSHIWFLRGTPSAIGLLLGMTIKNLERVIYFASYVIQDVEESKLNELLVDKEAEFIAAHEAIKQRYEKEAEDESADVKLLAEKQTKELEDLAEEYDSFKSQATGLKKCALISESDYRNLPENLQDLITVGMGGTAIRELLEEVKLEDLIEKLTVESESAKGQRRKKLQKRLRLLENMHSAGIKPTSMCLTILPVIPPDLRPMVQLTGGRFATSDMNDLYRRVINRNNRLKKLIDLNAPEVIQRNEQRMLQEAVDALIDNNSARSGRALSTTGQRRKLKSLSDLLKGKHGRFRQNLLGKRVDYSGRSVIVAGPELKIFQCGLPKTMALELFKPFVIGRLIALDLAYNIKSATRLIETSATEVWDALDFVIEGKYVLLNRAPSLHRLSIQAFQPVLIEGRAIRLHPLVCAGFNADFDGDQMAVHLPLSDAAQAEARELMSSSKNLLKPADGTPILHVQQDIVLGCYYLTYEPAHASKEVKFYSDLNEALMAFDAKEVSLQDKVNMTFRGNQHETTLGSFLFNEVFPEDFPFQDDVMTKKKLSSVLALVYQKYGQAKTAEVADELKDLGFKYSTVSGLSLGMDDFEEIVGMDPLMDAAAKKVTEISDQFDQGFLTDEERYRLTVDTWIEAEADIMKKLTIQFNNENSAMAIAALSGARGNIGQVMKSVGMLGITTDTSGKAIELPIKSGYKKGLTPIEYFTATRGARKAMIDTALKTADSGYLTRRLVDVAQDVFTEDNGAEDPGFTVYRSDTESIGVDYSFRLTGRFVAEDVKDYVKAGELITRDIAEKISTDPSIDSVKIHSVLSVRTTKGIPTMCYGTDPATGEIVNQFHPVGVIAAQSIGEPGTQLTLRTFHAGGSAAADDITQGLPRVEEIFEARAPKGEAFLSEISGLVSIWEEGDKYKVQITPDQNDSAVLSLAGRKPVLANETIVQIGDVIADIESGSDPLIAKIGGKIVYNDKEAVITPEGQNPVVYDIPSFRQLAIKDGDYVNKGDRLSNGSINLHELMDLQGVEATQRYIMNEILTIFVQQGQNIADKHLEIIVRQMFDKVRVEDPGDSEFVIGDVVSRHDVVAKNSEISANGGSLVAYTQLLLGITKASLSTDSFLSAASFQDTTRVLIGAATSGKVDKLYGLKENVILGRKIPVGTGVEAIDQ